MPFDWTLNPYRGCTHGCHYCFARRYHVQFEMDADDEFASVILVKQNLVERAGAELDRAVVDGASTSPLAPPPIRYQPIEGHYKLDARRDTDCLARGRTPIGLITKGPMVVRDSTICCDQLSRQQPAQSA